MKGQLNKLKEADIWAFDIDGTLVDSLPVIFAAFNDYTQSEYLVSLSLDFVKQHIMVGTAEEIIGEFERHLQNEYRLSLKGCIADDVPKWLKAYKACKVLPTAYDGAVELLLMAQKRGKKVPLITSGSQFEVEHNLAALNTYQQKHQLPGKLYDTIVMWEDVIQENGSVLGKPHQLSMEIAHNRMGTIGKEKSFYVGDGGSDVLFGKNVGATTIFLETSNLLSNIEVQLGGFEPDFVFANIMEMYEKLR